MPAFQKTPKEVEDYIVAHINNRPRTKVAKDCGVCMSTLYRIIRQHGGELRHDLSTKHENIEETIRKLWPTMTASEIAKATGISRSVVIRWKGRLGVKHSPETESRIKQQRDEKFRLAKLTMDRSKMAASWKHTRRMDEWRALGGMKQKTKFKIKVMPNKIYRVMWYLQKKYNYFFENDNSVVYFDSVTTRAKNEKYFIEKYGIRFEEADG